MKRNMRFITLVGVCLALVMLVTVSAVGAGQDEPVAAVMVKTASAAEQAASMQWTAAMRAAAQPMDMSLTPEQLAAGLARMDQTPSRGLPGYIPGGGPGVGADEAAAAGFPATIIADDTVAMGEYGRTPTGTRNVFTAFEGNKYPQMWKTYPYKAVGFMTLKFDGLAYGCTATVIGDNVIVTAARCVYNNVTGKWADTISYCPAYKAGTCPYGAFPARQILILNNWANPPDPYRAERWDVAIIILGTPRGKSVDNLVGYLGHAWNLPYVQLITLITHPRVPEGGSRYSYICMAESFQNGTDIIEMGCDGTSGSGAPWIKDFRPLVLGHTSNLVTGVLLYGYGFTIPTVGGVRFSSDNIKILCDAVPNC